MHSGNVWFKCKLMEYYENVTFKADIWLWAQRAHFFKRTMRTVRIAAFIR